MPLAPVNGAEIYYESHGDGFPLVLAHGGGSNHLTWFKQVYDFKDRYRVVTFDHRGFGNSTGSEGSPKMFADDLEQLLDHLRIERAALLGQSMGGYTVASFTSRHPERVAALVMTSGSGGLLPAPVGGHSREAAKRAGQAASYVDFLATDKVADGFFSRDPREYFLFHAIGMLNFRVDPSWMPQVVSLESNVKTIADAKIPSLLIAGEEDVTNLAVMREIAKLIPSAVVAAISDAGHHVMFECAEQANAIVRAFLDKHLSA